MSRHFQLLTAALALLFLGVHIQSLPRSLEDIDSINFALGVESFQVADHRPHPPGYPVFIAMGKLSTRVVAAVAPGVDRTARAAIGLAIWGVVAGTLFVWVLFAFWNALGWGPLAAWCAAALGVVSPLFWFTSARPLSDAVALVAAMAVQGTLVAHGMSNGLRPSARRSLVVAALFAGVLIGVRTQTMWLTGPLLVVVLARDLRRLGWRSAVVPTGAAALGCLLWAVPLVVSSGGLDGYLAALADQGREDFSGIAMLATSTGRHLLNDAMQATFIRPWRVAWLGQSMTVLALVGLLSLLGRQRRAALFVTLAFGPYLLFHLAFHETETVRYALPVAVGVAGLAMRALLLLPARLGGVLAGLVILASLVTAQSPLRAFAQHVPPTFVAFQDAAAAARHAKHEPFVVPQTGMRRVADWYRPEWPGLPATVPGQAWLHVVDYYRRAGAAGPVWYMTDRRRTDAVLFDPRARRVIREYFQDPEVRRLVGQSRQDEVRWWEIAVPGWMLGQGWALSPEVAGVTFSTGRDPYLAPAEGYVRRGDAPHRMLIGGRYLTGARDAAVTVEIDDRVVARWAVTPAQPRFLQWIDLDAETLAGAGPYASVRVHVEAAAGPGTPPRIGLEQFDFAPVGAVMAAFDDGWQEPETDVDTGRSWRWAGPRATLLVYASGPARLTLDSESSLRYLDRPSTVVVSVEGREVSRFAAAGDFTQVVDIPAELLTAHPSLVTVTTDQSFVPAERDDTADRRQLAQRFFRVEVTEP